MCVDGVSLLEFYVRRAAGGTDQARVRRRWATLALSAPSLLVPPPSPPPPPPPAAAAAIAAAHCFCDLASSVSRFLASHCSLSTVTKGLPSSCVCCSSARLSASLLSTVL